VSFLFELLESGFGLDALRGHQRVAEARQREAASSFENIARMWWEWWAIAGLTGRFAVSVAQVRGSSNNNGQTLSRSWLESPDGYFISGAATDR
jgi:hypothetical protein